MSEYYSTIMPKVGKIEDYLNKPVSISGKNVGKISNVKEVENGYLLTLEFIEEIKLSTNEPFSFSISGGK